MKKHPTQQGVALIEALIAMLMVFALTNDLFC